MTSCALATPGWRFGRGFARGVVDVFSCICVSWCSAEIDARGVNGWCDDVGGTAGGWRLLRTVFASEVVLALHLDEAADGALEFEREALAAVELDGRGGGGDDEIDVAVVELVDECDEAAGFVFAL